VTCTLHSSLKAALGPFAWGRRAALLVSLTGLQGASVGSKQTSKAGFCCSCSRIYATYNSHVRVANLEFIAKLLPFYIKPRPSACKKAPNKPPKPLTSVGLYGASVSNSERKPRKPLFTYNNHST
jgi:hypothetical protein